MKNRPPELRHTQRLLLACLLACGYYGYGKLPQYRPLVAEQSNARPQKCVELLSPDRNWQSLFKTKQKWRRDSFLIVTYLRCPGNHGDPSHGFHRPHNFNFAL